MLSRSDNLKCLNLSDLIHCISVFWRSMSSWSNLIRELFPVFVFSENIFLYTILNYLVSEETYPESRDLITIAFREEEQNKSTQDSDNEEEKETKHQSLIGEWISFFKNISCLLLSHFLYIFPTSSYTMFSSSLDLHHHTQLLSFRVRRSFVWLRIMILLDWVLTWVLSDRWWLDPGSSLN